VTDEKGRFTWPLDVDRWWTRIHVSAKGHVDLSEDSSGVRRFGENRIVLHRAVPLVGRVLRANDLPLADAVVVAPRASRSLTGADGTFRLDAVPLGRVDLDVSRHGFDLATFPVETPAPEEGLTLRLPPLRTIPITVVDGETGEPVPGTTIALALEGVRVPAVADAEGRMGILVPEGAKLKSCIALTYPGEPWSHSHLKDTTPGEPVVLRRPPIRRLPARVRVVTHMGDLVAGAVVVVQSRYAELATAATGADGTAMFGIPDGEVPTSVMAWHPVHGVETAPVPSDDESVDVEIVLREPPGLVSILVLGEDDAPLTDAYARLLDRIDLADGEGVIRLPLWLGKEPPTVGAPGRLSRSLGPPPRPGDPIRTVVLSPEAVVRGTVVDARGRPVPRVKISAVVSNVGTTEAVSDDRGRFELGSFRTGQAELLSFDVPGGPSLPGPWARAGVDPARIVVPALATLRFRASSESLADADSDAGGCGEAWFPERWDEYQGVVPFLHLGDLARRGDDWVVRLPAGRVLVAHSFGSEAVQADLTLEAGSETLLRMTPMPRVAFSGRVVDGSGAPVAGASIESLYSREAFCETTEDGRFFFSDEDDPFPWPIRLLVKADGYAPLVTRRLDFRSAPDLTLRLSRGGALRVRAIDADGPVSDCWISASVRPGAPTWWEQTDAEGAALMEHLTCGPITAFFRRDRDMPVRRTVEIEEGKTTELTVTLPSR
jgi:hypothetical protein